MTPGVRKLALTAHVTFSVSWLGAVASFLALAVAGLASANEQTVRSAYLSMDLVGWLVIVPLCFASLLTGLIQGLSTPWGLFRHYWVLLKLVVTVALTILLVVHMQPTRRLATIALEAAVSGADLHQLQMQLATDAASALLALLVVVTLAIYKPRGVTRYGARRLRQDRASVGLDNSLRTPTWVIVFVIVGIVSLIAVMTLSGAGGHHGLGRHASLFSFAQLCVSSSDTPRNSPSRRLQRRIGARGCSARDQAGLAANRAAASLAIRSVHQRA